MRNSASLRSSGMTDSTSSEMFQSAAEHEGYAPAPAPTGSDDDDNPFASAFSAQQGGGAAAAAAAAEYAPAPEPEEVRLSDDPGRQMHASWDAAPGGGGGLSPSASLPSPPSPAPFANNPERWARQQEQRRAQEEADVERGGGGGGMGGGGGAPGYDARWVDDVSRMAGERGSEAVEGAMEGGRWVFQKYQGGEITQEVVCVGLATLAFVWFMYWLVLHLHWSLQWILLIIAILFTLRTCCGVTDIDRWILEPLHREFPELVESMQRWKRSAERKVNSWRGGRAAQMSSGIYAGEDGSDDEDAPLLSRSLPGDETSEEELARLRRENLMTSQELSSARDEIDRLRGGAAGGGGGGGRGFDAGRGNQMEEL